MNLKTILSEGIQTQADRILCGSILWNYWTGKTNLKWKKVDWYLPGDSGGGIDCKQAWGNLLGDENVLYLDWSGDYVGVHTCEHASNCSLQMGASCWVKVKTKPNELMFKVCSYPHPSPAKHSVQKELLLPWNSTDHSPVRRPLENFFKFLY